MSLLRVSEYSRFEEHCQLEVGRWWCSFSGSFYTQKSIWHVLFSSVGLARHVFHSTSFCPEACANCLSCGVDPLDLRPWVNSAAGFHAYNLSSLLFAEVRRWMLPNWMIKNAKASSRFVILMLKTTNLKGTSHSHLKSRNPDYFVTDRECKHVLFLTSLHRQRLFLNSSH